MCGMGRCGTLHAWEQEDIVPDIQTIAKGLGGGYVPVSGILINDSIVQTMDKGTGQFRHGQTYQGHPVSCAAALAVQRTIKEQSLLDNVREMGRYLEYRLRQRFEDHPHVGDIRGKGLFWGVSLMFISFLCTFDSESRLTQSISIHSWSLCRTEPPRNPSIRSIVWHSTFKRLV